MLLQRFLFLSANVLAGFLDFTIGALIVVIIESMFGASIVPWHLIAGSALAVLPDFDLIVPILLDTVRGDHHQTLFHRPMVMLPTSIMIGWFIGGGVWASIAGLCVFWHFLHDTRGLGGGGIAWFWPFSEQYWSLRGTQNPRSVKVDYHEWIYNNWLRPSILSVREVALGSILLAIAAWIMNRSLVLSILLFVFVWSSVCVLWIIWQATRKKKKS
jgi:hypothetical protein